MNDLTDRARKIEKRLSDSELALLRESAALIRDLTAEVERLRAEAASKAMANSLYEDFTPEELEELRVMEENGFPVCPVPLKRVPQALSQKGGEA